MRILHTSDWHIGKVVNGFSMLEDQEIILENLIIFLKDNNVNALIISGDLYDRSIPPQEAIKLLDNTFNRIISELGIPILANTGNHDGAQRLTFANKLYSNSGLHIVGELKKEIEKITLYDEYGAVNFYILPYFHPNDVGNIFSEDSEKECLISNDRSFNKAFDTIMSYNIPVIDFSERNILIAHGFFGYWNAFSKSFDDQIISESELSVGGMDIIDLSPAKDFDYIALGHLHAPQKVKNEFFRYSGSLLKYSIDEAKQKKSVVLLDIKEKGNVNFSLQQLHQLRDIRIVSGYMKDLCESEQSLKLVSEDYIFVELLDKEPIYDSVSRLRQTFPNIMGVKIINSKNVENSFKLSNVKKRDLASLFVDFYKDVTSIELAEDKHGIIENVISYINSNSIKEDNL